MYTYDAVLDVLDSVPKHSRRVLLDLSQVSYIDSLTLGALLLAKYRWDRENRVTATVVPNAEVHRVLAISGILRRLNVFGTLDEALMFFDKTKV